MSITNTNAWGVIRHHDYADSVEDFSWGKKIYASLRDEVFTDIKDEIEGYGARDQEVTSNMVWLVCRREGMSWETFKKLAPKWAAEHVTGTKTETKTETKSTEEIQMALTNNTPIQTTTFIYGIPLDRITDDQVYEALTKINEELNRLNLIPNRPASMTRRILELKQAEAAIIAAVDDLDAEKSCST